MGKKKTADVGVPLGIAENEEAVDLDREFDMDAPTEPPPPASPAIPPPSAVGTEPDERPTDLASLEEMGTPVVPAPPPSDVHFVTREELERVLRLVADAPAPKPRLGMGVTYRLSHSDVTENQPLMGMPVGKEVAGVITKVHSSTMVNLALLVDYTHDVACVTSRNRGKNPHEWDWE